MYWRLLNFDTFIIKPNDMKKIYTLLFIFISISVQAQIIENPGFEEWETLNNGNPEPVDWSSIQSGTPSTTANLAPQVLFQSTDAHTGDYSMHLKNVFVSIANTVANGIASNGEFLLNLNPQLTNTHTDGSDAGHYTYCTTRPDSIVGYYKYTPVGDDICQVQALLHTGADDFLPDPDSTGWIAMATFSSPNAENTEWLRFSAPFEYFSEDNPNYILFNVSSGNGYLAVAGSEAWFDDFELVYNPVGLNEEVANNLLSVYTADRNIVVDLRKFGAGEQFDLEIYSISGQLVRSDITISGYTKEFKMENSGVYICKLQSKDGLTMTKKVVVQ
jgi:hypothetical protein